MRITKVFIFIIVFLTISDADQPQQGFIEST
jgi:hypothetical protein